MQKKKVNGGHDKSEKEALDKRKGEGEKQLLSRGGGSRSGNLISKTPKNKRKYDIKYYKVRAKGRITAVGHELVTFPQVTLSCD